MSTFEADCKKLFDRILALKDAELLEQIGKLLDKASTPESPSRKRSRTETPEGDEDESSSTGVLTPGQRDVLLKPFPYDICGTEDGFTFVLDSNKPDLCEEFLQWLSKEFDVSDVDRDGAVVIDTEETPAEFVSSLEKCNNKAWLDMIRKVKTQ